MASFLQTKDFVLRQLSEAEESAAKLIVGVSPAQASWQAEAGKSWNIWQCQYHLVLTNRIYTTAILQTVAKGASTGATAAEGISPGWFGRWFISQLEPPACRRQDPSRNEPTRGRQSGANAARVCSVAPATAGSVEALGQSGFHRAKFRSPFASVLKFTVGTGMLIITAQDRRHLWQAEQVKQGPEYPKS
jgi:DinB superfamily